jgi:hypothetical protein
MMGDPVGSTNVPDTAQHARRAVPRYTLIATAELIDPGSGVRLSGRVSEIGRNGCFMDILNTLPAETMVLVRITRDQGVFESPARIVYVLERMGMGIGFVDPPAEQLRILDSWLADLNTP